MNPFLAPNYEAALEALTRGPMTSNQDGVLIRPVDQLAEAVRSLHGKVAGLVAELSAAHESFEEIQCGDAQCQSKYGGCDQVCKGEAYRASQRIEAALAANPTAAVEAVEGMRRALEEIGSCQCPCQPVGNCLVLDDGTGKELRCMSCVARAALAAWKEATRG